MPFKFLLAAATLASAVWSLSPTPSSATTAETTTTLKFGYILSEKSQLGAGGAAFTKSIDASTSGRYVIEQYPYATLGGEVEMLKAVQLGTVDLAFITGAPLPNVVPEVGIFNIPFIFRDAEHAHAVLDGEIGADYLRKFKAKGLLALAWGENGMRHITNSKKPIRTPDDLQGLKLRLPQSEVMMTGFRTLGADARPLPFPQLFGSLKAGKFDGQENPIATIVASGFDQVQEYLTLSAHVYDPALIVMSLDTYEELPPEDRAAFLAAAKAAAIASRKFAAEAEAEGVAALNRAGMQVVEGVDRAAFEAALAPAQPAFGKLFDSATIERIRAFN